MIQQAIAKLLDARDLFPPEAEATMEEILTGRATDVQIGAFLAALRMKGETAEELAYFVQTLRGHAVACRPKVTGRLVDTCGTGGDGAGTFNISTAAAFVAAGAGVPIVKHGNRGVSSRCGSADVMEALGIRIDLPPERMCRILEKHNIAFFFAPLYHPAMRRLVSPRRELGVRTVFNILGPLLNPAGAHAHLLGVYDPALGIKLAKVLKELGVGRAMVVHGDGIDEITLHGRTYVVELKEGAIRSYLIHPNSLGMELCPFFALRGGDAKENAMIIRALLAGEGGPRQDVVLLNAGAAIYVGERAMDLREGVEMARESIESGRAEKVLESMVRESGGNEVP